MFPFSKVTSHGIWDHKPKEQDKQYFKELRDGLRVFRQNNKDHKILQILNAVAIWRVTGQGFQNTKWPAVLYY